VSSKVKNDTNIASPLKARHSSQQQKIGASARKPGIVLMTDTQATEHVYSAHFVDDQNVRHLTPEASASVLNSIPSSPNAYEALLKERLVAELERYRGASPPAVLQRYRFWDPIYIHGRAEYGIQGQARVPLGFVCAGVAEIIDPDTVKPEKSEAKHERDSIDKRLENLTGRLLEKPDRIDVLILPGSPIGLFETTDLLLKDAALPLPPVNFQHSSYALFSGTRTIYPCVSPNSSKQIKHWLEKRAKSHQEQFAAVAKRLHSHPKNTLNKLTAFLNVTDSHPKLESFLRLLLEDIYPTPWSTYILYFSDEFVLGLNDTNKRFIFLQGWSRMSAVFEDPAIKARSLHGNALTVSRLLQSAAEAADGRRHCLVPATQCPEVLENTGLAFWHKDFAQQCGLYADHVPPLLVPGYIRKAQDWGVISLRANNEIPQGSRKRDSEELRDRVSAAVAKAKTDKYVMTFIQNKEDIPANGIDEHFTRALHHELVAKKHAARLIPLLHVRRTT
jgi:hypothetical protein